MICVIALMGINVRTMIDVISVIGTMV